MPVDLCENIVIKDENRFDKEYVEYLIKNKKSKKELQNCMGLLTSQGKN
jgi:hypothetical protein